MELVLVIGPRLWSYVAIASLEDYREDFFGGFPSTMYASEQMWGVVTLMVKLAGIDSLKLCGCPWEIAHRCHAIQPWRVHGHWRRSGARQIAI